MKHPLKQAAALCSAFTLVVVASSAIYSNGPLRGSIADPYNDYVIDDGMGGGNSSATTTTSSDDGMGGGASSETTSSTDNDDGMDGGGSSSTGTDGDDGYEDDWNNYSSPGTDYTDGYPDGYPDDYFYPSYGEYDYMDPYLENSYDNYTDSYSDSYENMDIKFVDFLDDQDLYVDGMFVPAASPRPEASYESETMSAPMIITETIIDAIMNFMRLIYGGATPQAALPVA